MLRLNSGQVIVNRGSTWKYKALRVIQCIYVLYMQKISSFIASSFQEAENF